MTINSVNIADADDSLIGAITFIIDGGGSVISTGVAGDVRVPFDCTIQEATLLADLSGSIAVDIWKTTYANYDGGSTHPVDGDSITASAVPTISSSTKSTDTTLTGWTKTLSSGDVLRFNVDSIATIKRCTLILKVRKT